MAVHLSNCLWMVVKSQNSKILGDMLVLSVDIHVGNDRHALNLSPLFWRQGLSM